MKREANSTLIDLILGIVIFVFISSLIGGLITGDWLQFVLGDLLGGIIAIALSFHLSYTISNALELDSEKAVSYTKKMAILRLVIMGVAVFIALTFPQLFHIVGVLLGILSLKFSAYLQPFTSKYITNKIYNKGR